MAQSPRVNAEIWRKDRGFGAESIWRVDVARESMTRDGAIAMRGEEPCAVGGSAIARLAD